MKSLSFRYVFLFYLLLMIPGVLPAQSGNFFNQRDDEYRLLGLKRAKEAFDVARAEYERQKTLYDRDLSSQVRLEQARAAYADAEVNYQQSLLAVLFEKQYISVQSAVKYHAADGTRRVRLTLANTSGGTEEFRKLLNTDDDLFRSLQPDVINNAYISLMNNDNAIVSQPYETKISELRFGSPQTVDFKLLQDLDAVTVFLIYGNGSQRSMKIFLQKDSTVNKVEIQSERFSQEVELGKSAEYDLTLELYSGVDNTFSLEVVNLPREISHYFKSTTGSVRLRQVKFTESSRSKDAVLQITLPDRSDGQVAMDKSIPFYVLVLPADKAAQVRKDPERIWTEEELRALDVGFVHLELIPRGRGELMVRAPQLYHDIFADGTVEMTLELVNEGSRRLDHIEVTADVPLSWTDDITPRTIPSLDIGEEKRVTLHFTPPPGTSVGKYEVRIKATGLSSGQPISGSDKIATIEIKAEANIIGTVLIVLFILAVVGGIVVYGVRLSRK
ncbi:MAG: hypothetical protein JW763_09915 [candidate division Zixibacteria bacterium]|nr:hypothetical protein [candidate division Zixibacteria bacterium]